MASNNIARLGVVLGLDTAEFTASIDKAINENKKLGQAIKRDTNAAANEIIALKYATDDYGKTLTKVQLIEREIASGRFRSAKDELKQELMAQAAAYDAVVAAAAKQAQIAEDAKIVAQQEQLATKQIQELKFATEDYGQTLTKVAQIQREVSSGKFASFSEENKTKLLEQASAYDKVAQAAEHEAKIKAEASKSKQNDQAALAELQSLKNATEDYGRTLTKVELIEREINTGRLQGASLDIKQKLLAQAAAYDAVAASTKKATTGLSQFEKQNLMYQTTDFVTQVASGQNAMIAFMQQGGQLKDVMGGVKETFVKLAPIVFSATGAFVAGAAAAGTLGYAMYSGRKEFDDFNKSIILTGNYSKVTADDFGKMATKISASSRATVGDAKDILNTMISSGQFTSKAFDSVSKVIQRFSELTGTSAKDAANKLIPSLDGTAASAKRLNDQYNFLTLAQYKHIEALERQGKTQESIIYTADLLNKSFTGARTELGYIDSALDYTTKKWGEFWNAAMNLGKPDTPQEKLKKIEDELRKARGNKTEVTASGWAGGEQRKFNARNNARIQELEYEKMSLEENIRLAAKKNDLTGQKEAIDNRAKSGGLSADLALEKQLNDARRELKYASLMDSADEETKIVYESARKQEKLYSDHLSTLTGKDAEFDAKRTQIYIAEMQREMVERDQKLEEFRLKQVGKEVDAAQAERFARKKIADEEYKQDLEKLITQADYYAKAKDTAGVEKDKLQAQIKMVGLSEKQVKLAESEAKYQEDIAKNKLIPGITADSIDALDKQAKAVKDARDNNIMLADSLKHLQVVNDVVWSNITDAIDNFVNAGGKSFEDFAKNAIKQLMLIETKKQALALWDKAGGVSGIVSAGISLLGFADGGSPPVGVPSIVGERGPEIFVPRTAGTIIPNSMLSASSNAPTINYNGPYIANMSAIDTQSGAQFLAKNKQAVWATYQSANRSIPMSR